MNSEEIYSLEIIKAEDMTILSQANSRKNDSFLPSKVGEQSALWIVRIGRCIDYPFGE
ncbi:MAG: hypothetical protein ACFCAD_06430 [Pleurocapsa sp.]